MDKDEIWLSEEEEEEVGKSADPTFFSLTLTSQDQPGGKHGSTLFCSHQVSPRLG